MNRFMKELEKKIGYFFKNKDLLQIALTHSSCNNENKPCRKNNERLEFLGDSVISLVISEHLFRIFPHDSEGDLTKVRAAFVCDHSLAEFAKKIDLGKFLIMGKGEINSGGRERLSNLEDAFEALAGAIYLDRGLEAAKSFVLRFIPNKVDMKKIDQLADYKTRLQEIVQQNPKERVEYVLVQESGPDHDKVFEVELHLNSNVIGKGVGKSKKRAEQSAAKQALRLMGYDV